MTFDLYTNNQIRGTTVHREPDNGNVNVNSSNANFPNLGGNYNNGDNAGLFNCNVNNNSTNSNTNYGSRLAQYITLQPQAWGKTGERNPLDRGPCQNRNIRITTGTLVLP